jgi:hypothetical protein
LRTPSGTVATKQAHHLVLLFFAFENGFIDSMIEMTREQDLGVFAALRLS